MKSQNSCDATSKGSMSSCPITPPHLLRGGKKMYDKNEEELSSQQNEEQTEGVKYMQNFPEEDEDPNILLSILNVIVDYAMVPPTPLESDEFHWKLLSNQRPVESNENLGTGGRVTEEVEVPVIRIFGPVTRGDCLLPTTESQTSNESKGFERTDIGDDNQKNINMKSTNRHQSGCLHIHGAFPYLLARPVAAGPDGSSHHYQYKNKDDGNNDRSSQEVEADVEVSIDWDDPDSVTSILDEIHVNLEAVLRSSVENNSGQGGVDVTNNVGEQAQVPATVNRFIRQITVACGRGFFTYCSGSTAPFLKVEYYNPNHRWRVKAMLERGLDLPFAFHPYRIKNETKNHDVGHNEMPVQNNHDEGMSILQFRCYEAHLPFTMQFFKDYNLAGMSHVKVGDGRFRNPIPQICKLRVTSTPVNKNDDMINNESNARFFLRCNVPPELVWEAKQKEDSSTKEDETSAKTEENEEGTASIAAQLSVNDEFWTRKETSCDVELDIHVTNIMNVLDVITSIPDNAEDTQSGVHWRAVPSLREIWTEERERMATLLSEKDNFLSNSSSPLDGSSSHSERKTGNEHEISAKTTPPFTLSVKKDADIPGSRLACKGVKALFKSSPGLQADFRRSMMDIVSRNEKTIDEIDQKLKEIHVKRHPSTQESNQSIEELKTPTKSGDNALDALNALAGQFDSFFTPTKGSPIPRQEELEWKRNCDIVSNSFLPSSNLSTPLTSKSVSEMPYTPIMTQQDLMEVEDSMNFGRMVDHGDATEFLKTQAPEDSQTNLELINPFTLTPYENDVDDDDDDFLTMEEKMGEAGVERSLNVLATQPMTLRQELTSDLNEREESTSNENYGVFNTSQTQSHLFTQASAIQSVESNENSVFSSNDIHEDQDIILQQNSVESSQESSHRYLSTNMTLQSEIGPKPDIATNSPLMTYWKAGSFFELLHSPPTQKSFESSSFKCRFHPVSSNSDPSSALKWLGFTQPSDHYPLSEKKIKSSDYFEPVLQPPSPHKVKRWICQKRRENQKKPNTTPTGSLDKEDDSKSSTRHGLTATRSPGQSVDEISSTNDPLKGIGQQGGRIHVEGSGGLKASFSQKKKGLLSQLTIMSIEVHVQCRLGKAGVQDSRDIAMKPDPSKDSISAVSYVYACDPGSGEKIHVIDCGCIFIPSENEISSFARSGNDNSETSSKIISQVGKSMGISCQMKTEALRSEMELLLRICSIVQWKDPDSLISWDTHSNGLGYLIDRGCALGSNDTYNNHGQPINMVRLLGRCPRAKEMEFSQRTEHTSDSTASLKENKTDTVKPEKQWKGSVLGSEWDDRVGAGAGPSSIIGRLVLCGWKIIAEEVKHPNSSYQPAMMSTVLRKRIPFHDDLTLTSWYGSNKGIDRWRVLTHRLVQAISTIFLFDALDVIGRAGEAARLSGVEFSQSFPGIRGSQYKVEGVLLRALQSLWSDERGEKKGLKRAGNDQMSTNTSAETKSQTQSPWKLRRNLQGYSAERRTNDVGEDRGYFFFSPSKSDCNHQEALECQAMTLEPQSGFYFDPVIVCDFTALYPSLVIAYNLCYSTCFGKLDYHSTRSEMGCQGRTTGKIGPFAYEEIKTATVLKQHMKSLDKSDGSSDTTDRAYVLPTGTMFCAENVLKGVLPSVLDELLSTRAMLKKAAKEYSRVLSDPPASVLRQLEARQLALKYVANVTYGYTSATFSGRSAMPTLADAIVECGRRTLSNAIMLANGWGQDKNGVWYGAEVVYGDTDSIFIKLPGRSIKEAFAFGKSFCDAVTSSNPPPVQLKLEKVYGTTLLQTKKKYCGMKYDHPNQKTPTFEAKGIETIRKDQCALTQKILRNALITIFKGRGVHEVKDYLQRQWALIHAGNLPISDYILTGRVRSHYRGGKTGPVQAALARRLAEADPGRTMKHKERLPYVIVASPGRTFKLRDCVLTPNELLAQWDSFTIHASYYAKNHVNAALQRCLGLPPFNININAWYEACPKPQKRIHYWPITRTGQNAMISSYFGSDMCALCGCKCKVDGNSKAVVCDNCKRNKRDAIFLAIKTLNDVQQKANSIASICRECNGCVENSGTFAQERFVEASSSSSSHGRNKFGSFMMKPDVSGTISTGIVSPIANCCCIDCPVTYKRHEMRESEVEALALCKTLQVFD